MSVGYGKAEQEQQTGTWNRPIVKLYSQKKNFPEVLDMRGKVLAKDKDVVHVHKAVILAFLRLNSITKNSNILKGVMKAVFSMTSCLTGTL